MPPFKTVTSPWIGCHTQHKPIITWKSKHSRQAQTCVTCMQEKQPWKIQCAQTKVAWPRSCVSVDTVWRQCPVPRWGLFFHSMIWWQCFLSRRFALTRNKTVNFVLLSSKWLPDEPVRSGWVENQPAHLQLMRMRHWYLLFKGPSIVLGSIFNRCIHLLAYFHYCALGVMSHPCFVISPLLWCIFREIINHRKIISSVNPQFRPSSTVCF